MKRSEKQEEHEAVLKNMKRVKWCEKHEEPKRCEKYEKLEKMSQI